MDEWNAKCLGRLHPLSRIWCFMMGILVGMLCLRYKNQSSMPWFDDATWFFPLKSTVRGTVSGTHSLDVPSSCWWDGTDFKFLMFHQSWVLTIVTLIVIAADTITTYYGIDSIGDGTWLQAIVAFAQMNLMVAMVRHHEPENIMSRFLRSSWMQWLGELSMSIYLLHYPIMCFILWARYGFKTLTWPDDFDCSDYTDDDDAYAVCENYYEAMYWPAYSWIYLPILSIALAYIVYYGIEKPFHSMKF
jgi:peptidoglycan/LPS O-acetylase OafA/YrhL